MKRSVNGRPRRQMPMFVVFAVAAAPVAPFTVSLPLTYKEPRLGRVRLYLTPLMVAMDSRSYHAEWNHAQESGTNHFCLCDHIPLLSPLVVSTSFPVVLVPAVRNLVQPLQRAGLGE